jgi:hypothetical protein
MSKTVSTIFVLKFKGCKCCQISHLHIAVFLVFSQKCKTCETIINEDYIIPRFLSVSMFHGKLFSMTIVLIGKHRKAVIK